MFSASTAYKDMKDLVRLQMDVLARKLEHHEKQQAKDPKNWGYCGDLSNVASLLGEINNSFGDGNK